MQPGSNMSEAYNFGPSSADVLPVQDVLAMFTKAWRQVSVIHEPDHTMPEAGILSIDSTRARRELGWRPAWSGEEGVARTAGWYAGYYDRRQNAAALCEEQIQAYRSTMN